MIHLYIVDRMMSWSGIPSDVMVSSDFCDICGSDEEISYCTFHKKFLCLACDWKLHSVEIKRAYELYC